MSLTVVRRAAAVSFAALALTAAVPAFAGECAAPGTLDLSAAPTAPKAVTDDVLGAIDLGEQIDFAGHALRLRKLVVQPGGIVPLHSHEHRPALILTASGEITEYRNSCAKPIVHRAGDLAREVKGVSHYWVNNGSKPAILYSADVKAGD